MGIEGFYDKVATVKQWNTETSNELGADDWYTTYTVVTTIKVCLQQLGESVRYIAGTQKVIGTHKAFMAVCSDVVEGGLLEIDSVNYNVNAVNPFLRSHHQEAILERIN